METLSAGVKALAISKGRPYPFYIARELIVKVIEDLICISGFKKLWRVREMAHSDR
jgi:hypothetical protein